MASHITVTTAANPTLPAKGLNAPAGAETGTDAFADLLDDTAIEDEDAPKAAPATVAPTGSGLVDLALDAEAGAEETPDDTIDPLAAAIDAVVPIQQPVAPQALFVDVIDGLTGLSAGAETGQAPSTDTLTQLDQSLEALAGALGISLDDVPTADELATLAGKQVPAGADLEAQLAASLAPVAQDVLADAAATAKTDPALAEQLKTIGDKLAALLKGLDGGTADLDATASAGVDDAPIDPDLQAALDRLLKPAAATLAEASTPQVFAPAKLETSEVLSGKAADAADPASPSLQKVDSALEADAKADNGSSQAKDQRDKLDMSKTDAVVAAAANTVDAPPDAQTGPQTVQASTRVEAAPGPRPVVAGYQTSQQQLNLPQLAFEVVRQVNDGNSRFQMRLDPPELGKIDVRVDIDRSGQVTARLTVEKAETLDLMQRDQRGLEKALQQAGLDSSKTSLEFSLKQNPFSGGQQGQDQGGRQAMFGGDGAAAAEEAPAPQITLYRASLSASGVNIIA